jgi:hypothetical protein
MGVANRRNALEGGTRFRFPIIGSGFGPGGKFLGRMLAHAYGARAMITAAMLAAMSETGDTPRYFVHGRRPLGSAETMIGNCYYRFSTISKKDGGQAGSCRCSDLKNLPRVSVWATPSTLHQLDY